MAQKIKEGAQFFLIVFGAVCGIYTFVYKDIIVPVRRPPAVNLSAQMEELDRADGMILVRAHVVVTNRGEAKVWVPALWWNMFGVRFGGGEERTPPEFAKNARPLLERLEESMARFSSIRLAEVVAVGRILERDFWSQPKDETAHQQLLLVPEGRYDVLEILVDANITKSIDQFEPTKWSIDDDGGLTPTMQVKQRRWYESRATVVPFQPETNSRHRRLGESHDAGHNSTRASLRLKPVRPAAEPRPPAPR